MDKGNDTASIIRSQLAGPKDLDITPENDSLFKMAQSVMKTTSAKNVEQVGGKEFICEMLNVAQEVWDSLSEDRQIEVNKELFDTGVSTIDRKPGLVARQPDHSCGLPECEPVGIFHRCVKMFDTSCELDTPGDIGNVWCCWGTNAPCISCDADTRTFRDTVIELLETGRRASLR